MDLRRKNDNYWNPAFFVHLIIESEKPDNKSVGKIVFHPIRIMIYY